VKIGMRQRTAGIAVGVVLLLGAVASPYRASAQTPTPTPTAVPGPVVLVGSGEPGYSVNRFGPTALTVAQGTTVTFRANWLEPHTVTFPGTEANPAPDDARAPIPTFPGTVPAYDGTKFTNSGFVIQGAPPGAPVFASFQMSFSKTGTFPFLCILHPGMNGTVTVVAPGASEISTQAALDTSARTGFAAELTALKVEAAKLAAKPVTQTRNADGSSTWNIVTVGGMVGSSDVMQFVPATLNVQVGDTVVWQNPVPTPHTVTFLGGTPPGPPIMDLGDPRLRPAPAPAAGYDGTGLVSSGLNGVGFGPNPPFTVKFTKTGTFAYICVLHVSQGMGGTITVGAATQAAAPKTGSGGEASQATSTALVALLALLAVATPLGARAAARRSR
jgi:plastocyanin